MANIQMIYRQVIEKVADINMTQPEIKLSWVNFFIKPNWDAENADLHFYQRKSASICVQN